MAKHEKKPELVGMPARFYDGGDRYPYQLKVIFSDGHVETYERRIEPPAPQVYRCIQIIKKWRGYTPHELR